MATNIEVPSETKGCHNCHICGRPYDDPKLLPCIHAFCRKCLQTTAELNTQENGGGGTMPCPICTEPFSIPPEGFNGLPTDPFLSRLSKKDTPEDLRCAACLDRTRETNETDAPLVVVSCSECQRLTERSGGAQNLPGRVSEERHCDNCDIHRHEKLTSYCMDCDEVLCALCFEAAHQKHKLQSTKTAAEDFRNSLQNSGLSPSKATTLERVKELEQGLLQLRGNADRLRASVQKRRETIEKLLEKHVQSLLKDIESEELRLMAECERIGKAQELHVTCLDSFQSYCSEILARGSPDDICCAMKKLKRRSDELEKRHDLVTVLRTSRYPTPEFRGSDLDEFLSDDGFNIIGSIIGFGGQNSTKITRKEHIDRQNDRIDELKNKLKQTRQENLNLQQEVEELKQTRQGNLNLQQEVEELRQTKQENLKFWQHEVEELKQVLEHQQRLIEAPEEHIRLIDEREERSRMHIASLQQPEQMTVVKQWVERQMDCERAHNRNLFECLRRRIEELEFEPRMNRRVEELEVQQELKRRVEELEVQLKLNRRVDELEVQQRMNRRVEEVQQRMNRRVEEVQQRMNRRVEELEVQQMQNRMEIDRLSNEILLFKNPVPNSNLRDNRRYETDNEFSVQIMNERSVNVDKRVTANTVGLLEIQLFMTACDTRPNVVHTNDLTSAKTLRRRVKVGDLEDLSDIYSCPQKVCIYIIDMNSKKHL